MKLYIKNMVCPRCITAVRVELEELNISFKTIDLGEVELEAETLDEKIKILKSVFGDFRLFPAASNLTPAALKNKRCLRRPAAILQTRLLTQTSVYFKEKYISSDIYFDIYFSAPKAPKNPKNIYQMIYIRRFSAPKAPKNP